MKILLKLLTKGTSTAFVGDFANFVVGCTLVLPAAICYHVKKTKKTALLGLALGTVIMTIFGSLFNAVYLTTQILRPFGLPLDQIVAMGSSINGQIHSRVHAGALLCGASQSVESHCGLPVDPAAV